MSGREPLYSTSSVRFTAYAGVRNSSIEIAWRWLNEPTDSENIAVPRFTFGGSLTSRSKPPCLVNLLVPVATRLPRESVSV
jgi:hypothetical protein